MDSRKRVREMKEDFKLTEEPTPRKLPRVGPQYQADIPKLRPEYIDRPGYPVIAMKYANVRITVDLKTKED